MFFKGILVIVKIGIINSIDRYKCVFIFKIYLIFNMYIFYELFKLINLDVMW